MLSHLLRNDAKPAMVCSADDLLGWRDFPKGLRVLLLGEDSLSSADLKSKLEEMDYIGINKIEFCKKIFTLESDSYFTLCFSP